MTMPEKRFLEMDLARSLGIIYVAAGHYYIPRCLYLPVRAFHISIFFFISGYFFKEKTTLKQKFQQVYKRFRLLLVPYYAYNAFFALVTALLHTFTSSIRLGEFPTFHNFFIRPFIEGHQYLLFLPGWFVPLLFLVEIVHLFIYRNTSKHLKIDLIYFVVYLFIAMACVHWSFSGVASRLKFVLIRVGFSLFLFFLGFIYHRYLQSIMKDKADGTISFAIAFITLAVLDAYYNENVGYYISWAEFSAKSIWLPIVTSICGIYITLFIAKVLAKHLDENSDILYRIGQETYPIMSWHLSIYFLLNVFVVHMISTDLKPEVLNDIWFKYKPNFTWPIYISCGILLPAWLAPIVRHSFQTLPFFNSFR